MFSDDMLSRIRRKTVFILSLRFVLAAWLRYPYGYARQLVHKIFTFNIFIEIVIFFFSKSEYK